MAEPAKPPPKSTKTFWRHPGERDRIPDEGHKWTKEDEEAAKTWSDWVENHGLPLAKYRPF